MSELIDTYDHEPLIEQASVCARAGFSSALRKASRDSRRDSDGRQRPPCSRLIDDFEKHTGVPVLPKHCRSGMGALVLGSLLIEK